MGQQYRLDDLDKGGSRMITREDPDYKQHYVDDNIKNIVSDFDQQMNDRIYMTVYYDDGRKLQLPMGNMPIIYKAYINGQWVTLQDSIIPRADHFVKRAGIIYPVDAKGNMIFTAADTPNLVDARSRIYNYAKESAMLLEIAELVNGFAGSVALLGGYASWLKSFTWTKAMKPPKPTLGDQGSNPKRVPGGPGGAPPPEPTPSGGKPPPPDEPPPGGGGGGRPPGGGGGKYPYQVSLQRVQGYLQDPQAFQNGKPVFKTIQEFDAYWRKQQGFKLAANHTFGPEGGRQFLYLGPDNIVIKVKTAGYSEGKRMGVATMSLEVTDGTGANMKEKTAWPKALFKVDANGKIVAKNLHMDNMEFVRLPQEHPGRKDGLEWGVVKTDPQGKTIIQAITKFEVIQGGQGPKADQQAWADRGHVDLPAGFSGVGAENIEPDKQ